MLLLTKLHYVPLGWTEVSVVLRLPCYVATHKASLCFLGLDRVWATRTCTLLFFCIRCRRKALRDDHVQWNSHLLRLHFVSSSNPFSAGILWVARQQKLFLDGTLSLQDAAPAE